MLAPVVTSRLITVASLIALQVALALLFVLGKAALAEVPPVTFEAARRSGAAVILVGLLLLREGPHTLRLRRADVLDAVVPGILGFGLARACVMIGLSAGNPTNVALIDATAPAFASLIAAVAAVERPGRIALAGSAVALAGVAGFVIASGSLARPGGGDVIVLVSPLVWGLIYVWVAGRRTSGTLLRRTAWFTVAGALALSLPGFAFAAPGSMSSLGHPTVLPVLVLGIGVGVVENWLTFRAVSVIGAVTTAEFEYLVPVLAALAGVVLLGAAVLPVQVLAGVAILAGLWVSGAARAREQEVLAGRPCCV